MSTYKILTEDVRENILNRPEVKELKMRIEACCRVRDRIGAGLWEQFGGVAKIIPGTGNYMHADAFDAQEKKVFENVAHIAELYGSQEFADQLLKELILIVRKAYRKEEYDDLSYRLNPFTAEGTLVNRVWNRMNEPTKKLYLQLLNGRDYINLDYPGKEIPESWKWEEDAISR